MGQSSVSSVFLGPYLPLGGGLMFYRAPTRLTVWGTEEKRENRREILRFLVGWPVSSVSLRGWLTEDGSSSVSLRRWLTEDGSSSVSLRGWLTEDGSSSVSLRRWLTEDGSSSVSLRGWLTEDG